MTDSKRLRLQNSKDYANALDLKELKWLNAELEAAWAERDEANKQTEVANNTAKQMATELGEALVREAKIKLENEEVWAKAWEISRNEGPLIAQIQGLCDAVERVKAKLDAALEREARLVEALEKIGGDPEYELPGTDSHWIASEALEAYKHEVEKAKG